MKTVLTILTLLVISVLPCASAQENPFSQEKAELTALHKYEEGIVPPDTMHFPSPAENEAFFGSRLIRTATLLSTSTKERSWPVRVLIYGQSITGSKLFTDYMDSTLKAKYPYADITTVNKSIGGFGGDQILRTAIHDVYFDCPDLIIFHVYGGETHGELEHLFTNIRRLTTADIILMNHHLSANQKEVSATSYQYLRYIANKYNCELIDISVEWVKYLADNNLKPADLLRDNVHPNRHGNFVMSQLIIRHIRYNGFYPSNWTESVQTCYVKSAYDNVKNNRLSFNGTPWEQVKGVAVGNNGSGSLKLTFFGSRVDLIAGVATGTEKPGSARILIDGKPISAHPDLYMITRPSPGPGTWWPAIRQVSHNKSLIPETWTLKIESINADSTLWTYSVSGSKTGFDGNGSSDKLFVSKSGRVVIEADDCMFDRIKKTFKVVTKPGYETTWKVEPLFQAVYHSPETMLKNKTYKTTLVQGLENRIHTLEFIPNGDGPVPVEAFEIHRPSFNY